MESRFSRTFVGLGLMQRRSGRPIRRSDGFGVMNGRSISMSIAP